MNASVVNGAAVNGTVPTIPVSAVAREGVAVRVPVRSAIVRQQPRVAVVRQQES